MSPYPNVVEILGKREAIKMEVSQQIGLSGSEFSEEPRASARGSSKEKANLPRRLTVFKASRLSIPTLPNGASGFFS
jgi:hypothetical protein